MTETVQILLCFAIKEEAKFFLERTRGWQHVRTIITGIGRDNAEEGVRGAISAAKPAALLSCGFAGGLADGLESETVLFEANGQSKLEQALIAAGARPGKFHCASRIAITQEEKRQLRSVTGADAVEMESAFICALCRTEGIASA